MTTIKRILRIDDDSDDCTLFCKVVKSVDPHVDVHLVETGDAALVALETSTGEKPQLILLDINMPGMNGLDCLRRLKEIESLKDIPVIVYSNSSSEDEKRKAFSLDAIGFITKPDHFRVLKDLVSVLLTAPMDNWRSELKQFDNVNFR